MRPTRHLEDIAASSPLKMPRRPHYWIPAFAGMKGNRVFFPVVIFANAGIQMKPPFFNGLLGANSPPTGRYASGLVEMQRQFTKAHPRK
jgi:hypothetical protein